MAGSLLLYSGILLFAVGSWWLHRFLMKGPQGRPGYNDAAFTPYVVHIAATLFPASLFWASLLGLLAAIDLLGDAMPKWVLALSLGAPGALALWSVKEYLRPTRSRLPEWARRMLEVEDRYDQ